MQLLEKAPAKINLILRVFERRPDGFHRIETLMMKIGLCDDVEISVSDGKGVSATVDEAPELSGPSNLAWKAAAAYLEEARIQKGVTIRITKRIFVAGGLGGGSSDAAAVLRGLETLFKALGPEKQIEVGARIGSDVPFFLHPAELALATGRGEKITPWAGFPPRPVLLVNPGFPVSAQTAYEALGRPLTWEEPGGSNLALARKPEKWSDLTGLLKPRNDLQEVVERLHPEIASIRKGLIEQGADLAQMSGSGGTVFGLFEDWKVARSAEREVKRSWSAVLTKTGV